MAWSIREMAQIFQPLQKWLKHASFAFCNDALVRVSQGSPPTQRLHAIAAQTSEMVAKLFPQSVVDYGITTCTASTLQSWTRCKCSSIQMRHYNAHSFLTIHVLVTDCYFAWHRTDSIYPCPYGDRISWTISETNEAF